MRIEQSPRNPEERTDGPGTAEGRDIVVSKAWLWPALIVCGLTVVVLVNIGFIWVAVTGADEVVPTYMMEER